ncbi:acyltransferase [Haloplasma contractile]|uniref:UDP-3-O-acylglucosamine N-acyltransferase protein n=1 Tax=Haloplasma contractile SSD-17B TaxID=1033810 RepID=U2E8R1_9MOLU|nr:maltose O-acetyltransferase [Haloplasma contractile]ERJ11528.1 UDP-3-O-acylglucosamine N-acyltransferase protein [Haloplasma contractile SSD-17B]
MNREERERYFKDKGRRSPIYMECMGEFNSIHLPDEVKTFKLNNRVIMAGHSDIILNWLKEHIDWIDYYKVEYNRSHVKDEQSKTYLQTEVCNQTQTTPNNINIRQKQITQNNITIDKKTIIKENVFIKKDTEIAGECVIGPNVQIGESCIIGEGCILSGTNKDKKKAITLGNRVTIQENVIILSGVRIGNDVTIKMGSIVSSDIPDHLVVAGIPAKRVEKNVDPTIGDHL